MTFSKILLGAIALSCAGITAAALPATAAPAAPTTLPSFLVLTSQKPNEPVHSALLTCDPAGGTHPEAASVCGQITSVDGDLSKLPAIEVQRFCPMIVDPIDVSAVGLWRGQSVRFKDHYINFCFAENKSGSLFSF
jgi:hypothetical protein